MIRGIESVVIIATAMAVSTGCTTVIRSEPAASVAQSQSDRQALNLAAEELSETRWPKPARVSLGQRMAEAIEPSASQIATAPTSQQQAIAIYVAALSDNRDPGARLIADASAHLDAARAVIAAAAEIERSANVRRADLAILERAIGDLRACRGIYSAAMIEIAAVDENLHERRAELNGSFDAALREMGEIADAIAARTSAHTMTSASTAPASQAEASNGNSSAGQAHARLLGSI